MRLFTYGIPLYIVLIAALLAGGTLALWPRNKDFGHVTLRYWSRGMDIVTHIYASGEITYDYQRNSPNRIITSSFISQEDMRRLQESIRGMPELLSGLHYGNNENDGNAYYVTVDGTQTGCSNGACPDAIESRIELMLGLQRKYVENKILKLRYRNSYTQLYNVYVLPSHEIIRYDDKKHLVSSERMEGEFYGHLLSQADQLTNQLPPPGSNCALPWPEDERRLNYHFSIGASDNLLSIYYQNPDDAPMTPCSKEVELLYEYIVTLEENFAI
ncbi:MAG: hypothetical protein SFT92_05335 [Rickettsiales bacterium]|nr:hypothetical protein [Rickettsiales bacterium]